MFDDDFDDGVSGPMGTPTEQILASIVLGGIGLFAAIVFSVAHYIKTLF